MNVDIDLSINKEKNANKLLILTFISLYFVAATELNWRGYLNPVAIVRQRQAQTAKSQMPLTPNLPRIGSCKQLVLTSAGNYNDLDWFLSKNSQISGELPKTG